MCKHSDLDFAQIEFRMVTFYFRKTVFKHVVHDTEHNYANYEKNVKVFKTIFFRLLEKQWNMLTFHRQTKWQMCVYITGETWNVVSKIHILHFKFNNDMIVILHNCHVAILLTYLWHFQILFKWFILLSHWNRVDPAENQHQVNGTTITTAVHLSRFSVFVVGKSQVPLIPLTIALFYFNDP